MSYLMDQRRLVFWSRTMTSDNIVLRTSYVAGLWWLALCMASMCSRRPAPALRARCGARLPALFAVFLSCRSFCWLSYYRSVGLGCRGRGWWVGAVLRSWCGRGASAVCRCCVRGRQYYKFAIAGKGFSVKPQH